MAKTFKRNSEQKFIQGSLYEDEYLIRTLGSLATSPEIAMTELVANAWDAGATRVYITIPEKLGDKITIEDDGTGLTNDEFRTRWMKLGYNRLKHQGKKVIFPAGITAQRMAYGRNGVGRHGLLCFNNNYKVITASKGKECTFWISTLSESQPFVIQDQKEKASKKHGTKLEVVVAKNLPTPNRILGVISARFLHDPTFRVYINKTTVPLEKHIGLRDSRKLTVNSEIKLLAHFIDSQKTGKSTMYQGIAFWQGGRLVGEPSWILGTEQVIDGRTKYAKRYTVVIQTNDLADYISEDWTRFKKDENISDVYRTVAKYVNEIFSEIAKENIEETKDQIKGEFKEEYNKLSPLGKFEVDEAIQTLAENHPTAKQEVLSYTVEAIINLEKTRTGKELLAKLSRFSEQDVTALNELLAKWSVKDALSVLDEIDNRLSVIEAIRKLSNDKDVDELHILHPLVTSAKWLFGPEYDSPEFVSNRQLQTVVEKLFKKRIEAQHFNNNKKRPDLVILKDASLSLTSTEFFDDDSNLMTLNKILVIELKRGSANLSREERNQAMGYVEDFMNCGELIGNPTIDAFLIGKTFSEKVQPLSTVGDRGKIRACTFSQIIDTAERRLFGLRNKLSERYDDIPGMELFRKFGTQLNISL